jgi:hypothetical protein
LFIFLLLTREHSLNSLGGWKSFSEVFQFFEVRQIAFPRPLAVTRRGDVASRSAASVSAGHGTKLSRSGLSSGTCLV